MMLGRAVRLGLLGVNAAAVLATALLLERPLVTPRSSAPRVLSTASRSAPGIERGMDSLRKAAVASAPFRAIRHPADVAYGSIAPAPAAGPVAPPPPPRPALVLRGIAWGREPQAILEGVPSTEAPQVVRAGMALNGLTVRRIERQRVIVSGFDTTWTLTVRTPW